MNWINWLRGFSIRSRLIACMALVVVIGTIVGAGMSWRLMSLKGEFDNFAREEFTATQRMADLALNLSKLRGQEKAAIINTGDSVTAEGHFKAWREALEKCLGADALDIEAAAQRKARTLGGSSVPLGLGDFFFDPDDAIYVFDGPPVPPSPTIPCTGCPSEGGPGTPSAVAGGV